jgi:hypothetical protein
MAVRAIPEILMGPFVVGYDPMGYYIPYTLNWLKNGINFWIFLGAAPLFYVILLGVTASGIPVVLSVKIISPLLLGFLGAVVFFYANNTLSWSQKKSLLAALFATLYFVALRISWDLLRSELSLIFLFITLVLIERHERRVSKAALLSLAMVLVVLAHQLIAVLMFIIILATLVHLYRRGKTSQLSRLGVCSVPAAVLFFIMIYVDMVSSEYSLINPLTVQDSALVNVFPYPSSYLQLALNTIGFVVFCYLPLIPLLVVGFRHFKGNLQLKVWKSSMLVLVLFIFVTFNIAFGILPHRLIILLTYPLAFYAADGFSNLRTKQVRILTGFMLATFSVTFVVLPYNFQFPYYSAFPEYVPRSMLMNTVPLSDCQDTVNALQWVKNNMPSNSHLLVHNAFYGWASLSLSSIQIAPYGFENLNTLAQELQRNTSKSAYYLIWWANSSGWFGQSSVPSEFKQVYKSGRIAIFNYT